jgi:hypothetical protein
MTPRLIGYLALAAMLAGSIGAVYFAGRKAERDRQAIEELTRDNRTLENINDAIADPRTPDDIRERLRDLAQ